MANIPIQIPKQNFESISERIGQILAFELADQDITADTTVYKDRVVPFSAKNLPAVNVHFDSTEFDLQNVQSRMGKNQYFIDVHANGRSTTLKSGDVIAKELCQRISGIIAYILSSIEYVTLDYAPGLIRTRFVQGIDIVHDSEQDSLHTCVSRITFVVHANEDVNNIQATSLSVLNTKVKLNETEDGHYFSLITENQNVVEFLTEETILTDNTILI